MRWITFSLLLLILTALQTARLCAFPSRTSADWSSFDLWPRIEFLLILAIFYALYAAENAAPLAALLCGVVYDLTSDLFIGLSAVPLALICVGIVRIRLSLFREHAISQILVTLLAILAFGILSAFFAFLTGGPLHANSFFKHIGHVAGNAVYSAIAAPFLFWIFFKFPNLLGFSPHGPRTRSER